MCWRGLLQHEHVTCPNEVYLQLQIVRKLDFLRFPIYTVLNHPMPQFPSVPTVAGHITAKDVNIEKWMQSNSFVR